MAVQRIVRDLSNKPHNVIQDLLVWHRLWQWSVPDLLAERLFPSLTYVLVPYLIEGINPCLDFFFTSNSFCCRKVWIRTVYCVKISEFPIFHLLKILKWMTNCIYEQELQLHFDNFYNKNNCLQYSQSRPVQDSSKSETILSRCLL